MSIFVQMVSYNDFDVLETVKDCIRNAKDKDNLYFGIVLVQDKDFSSELNHDRIKVEKISKCGHGFARRKAQSFYDGQDYTLQIDSGCRFLENWDEELINSLNSLDSEKPIITNYANPLNEEDKKYPEVAYRITPFAFGPDGDLRKWPMPLKNINEMTKARMISDHFFFTKGSHCLECPHDQEIYFSEFESVLSIKSFVSGYDFFHHYKPILWRKYNNREECWNRDADWWFKSYESKKRFEKLLLNEVENYNLSGERSLKDYERYLGVDFLNKLVQKQVLQNDNFPPCNYEDETKWQEEYMKDYYLVVKWDTKEIEKCDDYDYWYFAVENENDEIIIRQDIRPHESYFSFEEDYKKISFKTKQSSVPAKFCIWPVSKSKGWLKKSKFPL